MQRQRLPAPLILRNPQAMGAAHFGSALDRAEQAIDRIERALATAGSPGRDEQLRERVRDSLAELDQMIREAEANG